MSPRYEGNLGSSSVQDGWRHLVADAQPERRFGGRVVFDAPVLVVDAVVLGDVEPDQAECPVRGHAVEQVLDLGGLAGPGPDGGLRQQHRPAGKSPDVEVNTRKNYYAPAEEKPGAPPKPIPSPLQKAMGDVLPNADVPLQITLAPFALPDPSAKLGAGGT